MVFNNADAAALMLPPVCSSVPAPAPKAELPVSPVTMVCTILPAAACNTSEPEPPEAKVVAALVTASVAVCKIRGSLITLLNSFLISAGRFIPAGPARADIAIDLRSPPLAACRPACAKACPVAALTPNSVLSSSPMPGKK